jgi:uncharacterized protein (DUF111 family)
MKVCYLECFSGISGDMLLGALVDAGVDADTMRQEIAKLGIEGIEVRFERCSRSNIGATNLTVQVAHDHSHRSLSKIEQIITASPLAAEVKDRAIRIFRRLATTASTSPTASPRPAATGTTGRCSTSTR